MTLEKVKDVMKSLHLPLWKLIRAMHISRGTFYTYAHQNFKGFTIRLKTALNHLKGSGRL